MKKVRTFDHPTLAAACRELEAMCPAPDLVIGIANGGVRVAALMFDSVPHMEMRCQRPSTSRKQSGKFRKILLRLPYAVLDALRLAESFVLQRNKTIVSDVLPNEDQTSQIANARHILIVDDAVDSGATMLAVARAVRAVARTDAEVLTASLTVTTGRPLIKPDFSLYKNILIRFPWSIDYKKRKDS